MEILRYFAYPNRYYNTHAPMQVCGLSLKGILPGVPRAIPANSYTSLGRLGRKGAIRFSVGVTIFIQNCRSQPAIAASVHTIIKAGSKQSRLKYLDPCNKLTFKAVCTTILSRTFTGPPPKEENASNMAYYW